MKCDVERTDLSRGYNKIDKRYRDEQYKMKNIPAIRIRPTQFTLL
jgi:hypothetical protein